MNLPKKKYEKFGTELDIGKWIYGDIEIESHGAVAINGHFDYDGSGQGLGCVVDIEFIKKFLGAFGCNSLQECNIKMVFVEHNFLQIFKLSPLRRDAGEEFDIKEWGEKLKAKGRRK